MKPLILPLVAFVICFALGGGAGAYVMKPAAADSTLVDSTHADSSTGSIAHQATNATDSSLHGATPATVPHSVETTPAAGVAATVPATVPGPSTPAATTTDSTPSTATPSGPLRPGQVTIASLLRAQSGTTVTMRPDGTIGGATPDSLPDYARMARLLSRMGPREAARTIERLAGTEAARALAAMSDKQAALVLSQLTPEKAASLLLATLALLPKTVAP